MSLVGYAAKFGTMSEDLGGFRETVMPGAFTRCLREGGDVKCLMNHSPDLVMGRTKNHTLHLEEDATGLHFRCVLPNTQAARDLHALVKRGDIDQCSFAFQARSQSWEEAHSENGDMYALRKLMDVDLADVSAVTAPAYPDTIVNARSLFPDGEPTELRSSIQRIVEHRASKSEEAKNAENAKTPAQHKAAAQYHSDESDKAYSNGKHTESQAHSLASMYHRVAAHHLQAAEQDGNDFAKTHAASVSDLASNISKEINDGGAEAVNKYAARAKTASIETRGQENQPGNEGAISTPGPFDPDAKEAWWNAFADEYDSLMKKGGRGYAIKEAIGKAMAVANAKVKVQTETPAEVAGQGKNPSEVPHEVVDTSGVDKGARYSQGTYEDRIEDINRALCGYAGIGPYCQGGYCCYYVVETSDDHVIICDSRDHSYYSLEYTYDSTKEDEPGEVKFGTMTPVDQKYVPSERALQLSEARIYKKASDVPKNVPADKKKQWMEVWNSAYKKAKKDGKSDADAESSAFAQANGVAGPNAKKRNDGGDLGPEDVSDPDSPYYDPESDEYDAELDSSSDEFDEENCRKAYAGQERDDKKTKKVAGKELSASAFAYVGDPNDISTWKYPVHDKSHAQNALARWGQHKGIPASKEAGVYKKIVAAAKKFGIEVSEEDPKKAGRANCDAFEKRYGSENAKRCWSHVQGLDVEAELIAQMALSTRMVEIEVDT